jgi:hypothetical protein
MSMNLQIDVTAITFVLLSDGWHSVANNSFELSSFEFHKNGSGPVNGNGVVLPGAGASWSEPEGTRVACPVTSILAFKFRRR